MFDKHLIDTIRATRAQVEGGRNIAQVRTDSGFLIRVQRTDHNNLKRPRIVLHVWDRDGNAVPKSVWSAAADPDDQPDVDEATPTSTPTTTEDSMSTELTTTQRTILTHAAVEAAGKITWFPDNIKGGALRKVVDALIKRGYVAADGLEMTSKGYDAIGIARPAPTSSTAPTPSDPEIEAAVAAVEATAQAEAKTPRTRDNTKQAQVIAMLKRPEGATIAQICEATGWQQHTVRGTFAGAFKRKLGLNIVSEKVEGDDRVYRVA